MKDLYIIGAGGFGRTIESYLINNPLSDYKLVGYLDDRIDSLDKFQSYYKVISRIDDFEFTTNDVVIIAIADVYQRKQIYESIKNKVQVISYIHPDIKVGTFFMQNCQCILFHDSYICTNVKIGETNEGIVFISYSCNIGHDTIIKNNVTIMPNVTISGNVRIGENVFIGTNATIIENITIGDNIIIGAGTVVIKDLIKAGTYVGNPARLVK